MPALAAATAGYGAGVLGHFFETALSHTTPLLIIYSARCPPGEALLSVGASGCDCDTAAEDQESVCSLFTVADSHTRTAERAVPAGRRNTEVHREGSPEGSAEEDTYW